MAVRPGITAYVYRTCMPFQVKSYKLDADWKSRQREKGQHREGPAEGDGKAGGWSTRQGRYLIGRATTTTGMREAGIGLGPRRQRRSNAIWGWATRNPEKNMHDE